MVERYDGLSIDAYGVTRDRTLMPGDQLDTDIRGARGVGIDAALVLTGVGRATESEVQPTWILDGLQS